MSRPALEVADILRAQGDRFLERYHASFDFQQLKAFRAISRCRTAALGGHIDVCLSCDYKAGISYNSCRNRSCPKCQAQARERWILARQQELLATNYFHVVFTVPHQLNPLALNNPACFYDLLFTATAQTLLEVAADPRHLGAGGRSVSRPSAMDSALPLPASDRGSPPCLPRQVHRWPKTPSSPRPARLQRPCRRLPASRTVGAANASSLPSGLGRLCQAGLGRTLAGLALPGRYTHRIAISNHRLLAFDGDRVTFRYKDYARGGKQRIMTLRATEFLRRFFLHVLPRSFVRIRHFGLLSNRFRSQRLPLARTLLALDARGPLPPAPVTPAVNAPLWHCPRCGGPMCVARRFTAVELALCTRFDSS